MSNIVAFRRGTGLATAADAELERAVSLALSDASFGEIRAERMTPAIRIAIEQRRDFLLERSRAASWEERCDVAASLQTMLGQTEDDLDNLRAVLRQYAEDLEGVPALALKMAARAFRRGEVGNGKFRPQVGELLRKAEQIAGPITRELQGLERALAAKLLAPPGKTVDPERRRELAAKMRADFGANCGAGALGAKPGTATDKPPDAKGAAPTLAEVAAHALRSDGVAVPPAVRAHLRAERRARARAAWEHRRAIRAALRQAREDHARERKGASPASPDELTAKWAEAPARLSPDALARLGIAERVGDVSELAPS